MNKHHINWHSAFLSGLQIELSSFQDILTYQPEFLLNKGQRRIDSLITKAPGSPPIDSAIARHFRQYNVVEYKGPGESFNVLKFFKALSYTLSLPDILGQASAVWDVTLTLAAHCFPRQLASFLREKFCGKPMKNAADVLEKVTDGVYDIHINILPVRLLILPELAPEEYLWLRCLANHLTPDTPLGALADAYRPHQDNPLYQNFMNAVIRASRSSKGDESMMCEALYELFADELEMREKRGKEQMASLLLKLISAGRSSEIERALREPEYYEKLSAELGV